MSPEEIDRITLEVYRARLNDACEGDADRQVEKDKDSGTKQASRSRAYRPVVLATLIASGLHEPYDRSAALAATRTRKLEAE